MGFSKILLSFVLKKSVSSDVKRLRKSQNTTDFFTSDLDYSEDLCANMMRINTEHQATMSESMKVEMIARCSL